MKRKVLYYISLIIVTILSILLLSTPLETIKEPLAKKTQEIIANQTVSPERLFLNCWRTIKNQYVDPKLNGQDWSRWKDHYLPYMKTNDDVYVAVNSMLQSLNDPYSRFMNMPEYEYQNIKLESNLMGIGITIMKIADKTVVSSVIEDSPAQKSGILVGDIIHKINEQEIQGISLEDIVNMIRGPKNTFVNFEIIRNKKIINKRVKRDVIKLKSVTAKMFSNNVAYIEVSSFMGMSVAKEFESALKEVNNADGLIIDLRGDVGGLLTNAVIIANMFVDKGTLVNVVYRNGEKINMPAQKSSIFKDKPIVILVNKGTASASEILTGALRDNKKAVLVGEKTYGKNSVQQIIPMQNKTGMNLTVAKYLMPNNEDIHRVGIKPDYEVPFTKEDYKNNKDPQLDKAKEIIKNLIAQEHK